VKRTAAGSPAAGRVFASGAGRTATRGGGEVIELEDGITVYPAREEPGRWRAVWHENGERRQCEASTGEKLAVKLEKVTERVQADAPGMKRPGAALIAHFLDPDRLPVDERWSRKHADTQRRLCERFAAPVIGGRVRRMISALVSAGLEGGYLANPRLAKVHWQARDRPLRAGRVSVGGKSALWVGSSRSPWRCRAHRL
jgi:hypothetical protein